MQETNEFFDACRRGDVEAVRGLHQQSPEIVNVADARGFTPLILAVYNNQPHVVDYLLNAGADPAAQDVSGNTALMGAAFRGYSELIPELIRRGADVNQRNHQGATALTFAATFGQMDIARMLLENGASIDVQDVRGKSPLDHAVIQENIPMIELLEQHLQS